MTASRASRPTPTPAPILGSKISCSYVSTSARSSRRSSTLCAAISWRRAHKPPRSSFRGACLVGLDLEQYPRPDDEALFGLELVEIALFCVPVSSVDPFRAGVHKALGSR